MCRICVTKSVFLLNVKWVALSVLITWEAPKFGERPSFFLLESSSGWRTLAFNKFVVSVSFSSLSSSVSSMAPGYATASQCQPVPLAPLIKTVSVGVWVCWNINKLQGAPKKEPLGKIWYLWNGSKFFRQIYSAYRGGFRPHILQNSSKYLVTFKN